MSQPRRYKAMSTSFSAYSTPAGGTFAGSDSGSSSGAGPGDGVQVRGVKGESTCFKFMQ